MWMHCQSSSCGRLFHVASDMVRTCCPDCRTGTVRVADEKHARMAQECIAERVIVSVSRKKKG